MTAQQISNRIVELLTQGHRYPQAHMQAHREATAAAAAAWHASPDAQ